MNRKLSYLRGLIGFLVLLLAAPPGIFAQSSGTDATFRQEELDQMLAPIALYPDSLLAQILVAATYPDQVTEADRWIRRNKNLKWDRMNAALNSKAWDLSVKALVPFPQVLAMMSDKMDWTQRVGDAFRAQQADVMDTIQRLRAKAHAQGNLKSTDQLKVVVLEECECIEIEPANPRVIYVPTYNPAVIYGSWWYPAYPPYAYNPYYHHYVYDPYYNGVGFVTAGLFVFAAGITVGSAWNSGWGQWDWGRHNVNVSTNRAININRNDIRSGDITTSSWHDVSRQRGSRGSGQATVGQSGNNLNSGRGASITGARPSAASVQQGLQQRGSNARLRRGKNAAQGSHTRMGSSSGQVGLSGSSGKSRAKRGSSMSSTRSKGQRGSTMSSTRSKGQRGNTMSSGKSRGDSLGKGGSSRLSGKSHGGGGTGPMLLL